MFGLVTYEILCIFGFDNLYVSQSIVEDVP